MVVELWDLETGNMINTYPSEDAALAVVRSAIEAHGRTSVAAWALGSVTPDGTDERVLDGDALAEEALGAPRSGARSRCVPSPESAGAGQ